MNIEILMDGVWATIKDFKGLPEDHRKALDKALSYQSIDTFFSTQSRNTGWDGRVHLLRRRGWFPAGLVPRTKYALQKLGYGVIIVPFLKDNKSDIGFTWKLRNYQQEACDQYLAAEIPYGIIHAAPRSGKTLMAAYLISQIGKLPALFVCQTLDIAFQARKMFESALDVGIIGLVGDGQFEVADITIATIQSLCSAVNEKCDITGLPKEEGLSLEGRQYVSGLLEKVRVVCYDEAHHVAASSYQFINKMLKSREHSIGLSGTPFRTDGKELLIESVCGPIRAKINYQRLIDEGYLVKPIISVVHLPTKRYPQRTAYPAIYSDYIVNNEQRNSIIAKYANQMIDQNKSIVIIVSRIKHGILLGEMIQRSLFLDAKSMPSGAGRKPYWDALNKKTQLCIITTLADEGLDIPTLDCVIIAAGGASANKTFQRLRALTAAKGKDRCYILDFLDNAKFLRSHSRERLKMYKSQEAFEIKEIKSG